MDAYFYLHQDSITLTATADDRTRHNHLRKFSNFLDDISYIISEKTESNNLVLSQGIDTSKIEDRNIYDYVEAHMDRDSIALFNKVMGQSQREEFTCDEIKNNRSLYSENAESCHALIEIREDICESTSDAGGHEVKGKDNNKGKKEIKMNPYMVFDKYSIVYDTNRWLTVRRQILGNHPENADSFMIRCKTYFPNLIFSDNCIGTIGEYLDTNPRKIVYCLACLNDLFRDFEINHPHRKSINIVVEDFSGLCGMDKAASPQSSKPGKTEDYTYSYHITPTQRNFKQLKEHYGVVDDSIDIDLRSNAHFKITQYDDNCRQLNPDGTQKCYCRIYFTYNAYGIFVGSMGPHV